MIAKRMLGALALLGLGLALPSPAQAAAPILSGLAWQPHVGDMLPQETVLRDSDGTAVTLGALTRNRPAIIDLGYFHCPSLCGVGRNSLLEALGQSGLQTGVDYVLVDLSINPAETSQDAAAAKTNDMVRFSDPGAGQFWHYVTADVRASTAIADAIGFPSRWDATLQQFLHPAGVVIATQEGQISGYLLGVGYSASDLRMAVTRAGARELAPSPSPILLLCFHFDQASGRYSFAVLKTLRLAAALTVAGIMLLLLWLRRFRSRQVA